MIVAHFVVTKLILSTLISKAFGHVCSTKEGDNIIYTNNKGGQKV